ncbi:nucleoside phosphorylase domain-containing protein [Aspergillus venezuelensis]
MADLWQFRTSDYHVACFTVLAVEFTAIEAALDRPHQRPFVIDPRDPNQYAFGEIAGHNVVVCLSGRPGPDPIAASAADLQRTFHDIRYALLVGIGGGVPGISCDIRLGDVVVATPGHLSSGIAHYDQGKQLSGDFVHLNFPVFPHRALQGAVARVNATAMKSGGSEIAQIMNSILEDHPGFSRPDEADVLFESEYEHILGRPTCDICDKGRQVQRSARDNPAPQVHHGVIASGNQLIKSAIKRDSLRDQYNIVCIEMEAAGIMGTMPSLVVRGISDYADSHKNDQWQAHAALAAAAYARVLLQYVSPLRPSTSQVGTRLEGAVRGSVAPTQIPTADLTVADLLDQRALTSGAVNWRESIKDLAKVLGLAWDLAARSHMAAALGIDAGPTGSAKQNTALRRALMGHLRLENGTLILPNSLDELRI